MRQISNRKLMQTGKNISINNLCLTDQNQLTCYVIFNCCYLDTPGYWPLSLCCKHFHFKFTAAPNLFIFFNMGMEPVGRISIGINGTQCVCFNSLSKRQVLAPLWVQAYVRRFIFFIYETRVHRAG